MDLTLDIVMASSSEVKRFCHECARISQDRGRQQTFTNVQNLGGDQGHRCYVIVRALQALIATYHFLAKVDWDGEIMIYGESKLYWVEIQCYPLITLVAKTIRCMVTQYSELNDKNPVPAPLLRRRRVTHCKPVLQMAREMLDNYLNKHDCRLRGEGFLPKRLVDVQSTGPGQDDLRVVVSANLPSPEAVRYTALSYCWGGRSARKDVMLSNTKEDIAAMERSLRLSQLPLAYQDAVKATRYLGIRYLWIDVLCIAQGDAEEWRTESLKMAQTYSHAFVTISADASLNCEQSFLDTQRYRALSTGVEVTGLEMSGVSCRTFARILDRSLYKHCDKFGFPPQVSTILTRGWTFQEGLLSRRVLSFRHTYVYFRCMVGGGGDYVRDFDYGDESRWRMFLRSPAGTPLGMDDLLTVWGQILKDFTLRRLTKAADRLVAIAGVASALRSRTEAGNLYWAGLWKDLFVQQLLWGFMSYKIPQKHQQHLQFPSWSWGSLMGPVEPYTTYNAIFHTKLVQGPCSGDDFDGTRSGAVVVEGPFVDAVAVFEVGIQSIAPVGLGCCVQTPRVDIELGRH